MRNKSSVETSYVEEVEKIDDNDLNKKERIFKRAIWEIFKDIKKVNENKGDKIFYKLPATKLCSYLLF